MSAWQSGPRQRDRDYYGVTDRWIARLVLLVMVVGMPEQFAEPSLAGLPFDFGAAAFFAIGGWVLFRMGFRTRLVARSDHFEVVNVLTVERIAYRDVALIELDAVSVRFRLCSGKGVRVWGLGASLLDTGGSKGETLIDRLRKILAERQGDSGPERTLTRMPDLWVTLALCALFMGAIGYRVITH